MVLMVLMVLWVQENLDFQVIHLGPALQLILKTRQVRGNR